MGTSIQDVFRCSVGWQSITLTANTIITNPSRGFAPFCAGNFEFFAKFMGLPPPRRGRALRGCERGATVERSETGERTMFAPAGQTTARAGQLCWLAALVARRQAPRPPAAINFRLFVGAAYMRPANLPPHPVSPSPPCRGRACPARSLASAPGFALCPLVCYIVGRGLDPSATCR